MVYGILSIQQIWLISRFFFVSDCVDPEAYKGDNAGLKFSRNNGSHFSCFVSNIGSDLNLKSVLRYLHCSGNIEFGAVDVDGVM